MSTHSIISRLAATTSKRPLYSISASSLPSRVAFSQVRLASTQGSSVEEAGTRPAAKGPSGPEAQAQGSDQRGKTTTYILPAVAAGLVAFAVFVRMTSSESTQKMVNTAKESDGFNDKLRGSKAKSIASDKANAEADKLGGK